MRRSVLQPGHWTVALALSSATGIRIRRSKTFSLAGRWVRSSLNPPRRKLLPSSSWLKMLVVAAESCRILQQPNAPKQSTRWPSCSYRAKIRSSRPTPRIWRRQRSLALRSRCSLDCRSTRPNCRAWR
uniref:Putative secreted protein n=1 Tax=Anopheles triannulatus TaxID=58253 RepID=A0A2M4B1C9_9DIPT